MASYKILVKASAAAEHAAGIPKRDLKRIVARIKTLEDDPRQTGCRKLAGGDRYRLRQGDYRIVYAVDDSRRIVEIYRIGHRSEICRR